MEIHLHPTLTQMWAPRGEQPEVPAPGKNQKRTVYGGLDYATGKFTYTTASSKCGAEFITFLAALLAAYVGRRICLVCDNGRFHHTKAVQEFLYAHRDQIRIYWLPPYCPSLNLIERFWDISNARSWPMCSTALSTISNWPSMRESPLWTANVRQWTSSSSMMNSARNWPNTSRMLRSFFCSPTKLHPPSLRIVPTSIFDYRHFISDTLLSEFFEPFARMCHSRPREISERRSTDGEQTKGIGAISCHVRPRRTLRLDLGRATFRPGSETPRGPTLAAFSRSIASSLSKCSSPWNEDQFGWDFAQRNSSTLPPFSVWLKIRRCRGISIGTIPFPETGARGWHSPPCGAGTKAVPSPCPFLRTSALPEWPPSTALTGGTAQVICSIGWECPTGIGGWAAGPWGSWSKARNTGPVHNGVSQCCTRIASQKMNRHCES